MKSGQRLHAIEALAAFPAALRVVSRLREAGAPTVFAGGSVRDSLLGLSPKDLDIATAAQPEVVESLFSKTLAVGKAFGTIVVIEEGHNFEVTTFRSEGSYLDGRHPSQVQFADMEVDAQRRDFTINALFYDPIEETVLDFVGGQKDLKARVLRTVGEAHSRFGEDHLRMLRAVRFVAQLGFDLDHEAVSAIAELASKLQLVSAERVLNEVKRLCRGAYLTSALETLKSTNLAPQFWPEAVQFESSQLKDFAPFQSWENAFAAVMWLAQSPNMELRLRAWKASRESLRSVNEQLAALRTLLNPNSSRVARARVFGSAIYADILVLAGGLLPAEKLELWIAEYLEVANADGSLPKAFVNGQDLLQLGVEAGPKMGQILDSLFELQLEGKVRTRAEALARVEIN